MKINVITKDDIAANFSMTQAIEAVKNAMKLYCMGKSDIPLRTSVKVPQQNGNCLFMPGYVSDEQALGIKIVSVFPDNMNIGKPTIPSTMILLNHETGEVNAIMDGAYLTELRTGAVAGAAADILSVRDSKIFALFGTGGQAMSQLEAVLSVRNIDQVKVFDIDLKRAEQFCEKMNAAFSDRFCVNISAVRTPDEAVFEADIITCVTTSKTPVFDGRSVKKGAHINGVGSFTPQMQEIDPLLLKRAEGIYADTLDGVLNEAGDIVSALQQRIIKREDITGELGNVLLGRLASRKDDEQITVFKTVGSAIFDVVTAKEIYRKILEGENKNMIEM